MEQKLKGIPETMLIPLWVKAVETTHSKPIIKDEKAVKIVSGIDYDFSKFQKAWLTQVGVSVRTMLLDRATRHFLQHNPGAVVINLGAGLDTRYERLNIDNIACWYDLDVPESIELRRQFFTETDRNRFVAKSVFDFSWFDEIQPKGRPVLVIAEGLLMYFSEGELRLLFQQLASRLSGAEMLFEMLAPFLVGKSKNHETLKKVDSQVEFKWGLKNSRVMETWCKGIKYAGEWNYYDYYKDRWRWFGYIGRMPLIGPKLSNRIIHLKFQ